MKLTVGLLTLALVLSLALATVRTSALPLPDATATGLLSKRGGCCSRPMSPPRTARPATVYRPAHSYSSSSRDSPPRDNPRRIPILWNTMPNNRPASPGHSVHSTSGPGLSGYAVASDPSRGPARIWGGSSAGSYSPPQLASGGSSRQSSVTSSPVREGPLFQGSPEEVQSVAHGLSRSKMGLQ